MSLPVWVELHVDDEVLKRDPDRASEARALVETIAAQAAERGARLSFRIRRRFAEQAAADDTLTGLQKLGHEVGVHEHGKNLEAACKALRAKGVNPRAGAPGLVQVGAAGREALLRKAVKQGLEVVTDHGPQRAWAYEGLVPRIEHGAAVIAPTVRPTDWGLMDMDGQRLGVHTSAMEKLRSLEEKAEGFGAWYFGVALHEHDLCPAGSLVPDPEKMDAFLGYLDERVVRSLDVPIPSASESPRPPRPLTSKKIHLVRAVTYATRAARSIAPLTSWRRNRAAPSGTPVTLNVDGREVVVARHGAEKPLAMCVVSLSGAKGGRRQGLTPFGVSMRELAARGWGMLFYDRAGTGASERAGPLTPGNRAHTADWRAVLQTARAEGVPVVALTHSAGVIPVLAACVAGDRPDALVDAEGPADRFSLVPPKGNELAALNPWQDAHWMMLEAVEMMADLGVPYARLQSEYDHVHGLMHEHARRMLEAARKCDLPVRDYWVLAGHLHGHPGDIVDALRWAREQAQSRVDAN